MAQREMTDRLALVALVDNLIVAIDAAQVFQIRRAAELMSRQVDQNLYALELDHQRIPGWDLGNLFKLGTCTNAWVIMDVELDKRNQRIALRVGRCIAVIRLPKCYALPPGVLASRTGAVSSAFSTTKLVEVAEIGPAGVVLDATRLLAASELEAASRVGARTEVREIPT